MNHRETHRAATAAIALLAGILLLTSSCEGGISLGTSADLDGAGPDASLEDGAPDAGYDAAVREDAAGDSSMDGTLASDTSADRNGDGPGPSLDSSDAENADAAGDVSDSGIADGAAEAAPASDAEDASNASDVADTGSSGETSNGADASDATIDQSADTSLPPDAAESGAEDGGADAPETSLPCGDAGEVCCPSSACGDAGLACNLGTCVTAGIATQGTRCSSNAACQSGLCLPIGATASACTGPCTAQSDCLAGWTCNPIGGQSGKACQCTAGTESCDGKDNDCNGIVDDVAVTDVWCDFHVGPGFVCGNGVCSCGHVCGVSCANTQYDTANCGACGTTCMTGAQCVTGSCGGTTAIAVGEECAILSGGGVACWGAGRSPVPIYRLTGPASAVVGTQYAGCALVDGGAVECWTDATSPVQTWIPAGAKILSSTTPYLATTSDKYVCAVLGDGTVECLGYSWNSWGNTTVVPNLAGVTALTTGTSGSDVGIACALLSTGNVKCWGSNEDGQLGDGTTTSSATPVAVKGLTGATAVSVGHGNACALLSDGGVECWGQWDPSAASPSLTPQAISGVSGAVAVSTSNVNGPVSCALLSTGTIECWGGGNGPTPASSTPVQVSGLTSVTAINTDCALLSDGTLECWGFGSVSGATTPTPVPL